MKTNRKKRDPHFVDPVEIVENAVNKYGKEKGKQIAAFATTLNKEMEKQEKDQDKMASKLEISPGALSNYRNGIAEPGITAVIKIAEYLNVDCNYLLTGIKAKNITVNADLGLSENAIEMLQFIKSPPDWVSVSMKRCLRYSTEVVNLLLEDQFDDIQSKHWPADDFDILNLFTAIHDYIFGSDHLSGSIEYNDGSVPRRYSAAFLWPEKCISEIRNRLDDIKRRMVKNNGKA